MSKLSNEQRRILIKHSNTHSVVDSKLKTYIATHKRTLIKQTFKFYSLQQAIYFNPGYIDWEEVKRSK